MRPLKLTISAFGAYADKCELDMSLLGNKDDRRGKVGLSGRVTLFTRLQLLLPSMVILVVASVKMKCFAVNMPTKTRLHL